VKFLFLASFSLPLIAQNYRDWKVAGGGHDSIRYSALAEINRSNVHRLTLAWTFDTGDAFPDSEMQANPIVVDGVLYTTTPKLRVIALDAATGRLIWSYHPPAVRETRGRVRNRGVVYWQEGNDRRIFVSARSMLYALDARTGQPVASFGNNGEVDLREGLGRDPRSLSISAASPGVVYKDLLIMGSLCGEDLPSAPGDIRAYDVRTGKIRWSFHTIPHPGEFGYKTWPPDAWKTSGGANSWPGLSLDVKRGIVFAPTGSAAFDFYGGDRAGDNLFANSVLALKAETGERVWHFQTVRHDVWDRDLPAAPSLIEVQRGGKTVDALAQITKSGHVFVFERASGRPLFPIEEREVMGSDIDGEILSRKQPLPTKPEPFARQIFTESMITKRNEAAHASVLDRFRKILSGPQFTPPSRQGTIVFPGFDGGGEWGGAAYDPATHLLYVNANEMPWILRIIPRRLQSEQTTVRSLYIANCASCHREDLSGTPPEFPRLAGIAERRTEAHISAVIRDGGGRMPGYGHLGESAIRALALFLISGNDRPLNLSASRAGLKWGIDGYNKFLDPDGFPAVEPPWGTLQAINLDTGDYAWKVPLGEIPGSNLKNTGSENYGGPVVTAGGLLFIGATNFDRKFRAFDKSSGKLLWETTLPFAGNATPAVYEVRGRQYVVIGAGGGKWGNPSGGVYVAFALPAQK
jgi:quinoprotein glucose dehydrogenase